MALAAASTSQAGGARKVNTNTSGARGGRGRRSSRPSATALLASQATTRPHPHPGCHHAGVVVTYFNLILKWHGCGGSCRRYGPHHPATGPWLTARPRLHSMPHSTHPCCSTPHTQATDDTPAPATRRAPLPGGVPADVSKYLLSKILPKSYIIIFLMARSYLSFIFLTENSIY